MSSIAPPSGRAADWDAVGALIASNDAEAVRAFVSELPSVELPRLFARLSSDDRFELLRLLDPEAAGDVLEHLPDVQEAELLEGLEPNVAAAILHELPSNERADVLGSIHPGAAHAVLELLPPEEARGTEALAQYPKRTAGGLMITEYLSYLEDSTVGEVLDDLRANTEKYQRHDIQYIYVTNTNGTLIGVLRLRDLVLTAPRTPVRQIMVGGADSVLVDAQLDALHDFFATRPYRGVPVVDHAERLVGVVRHADVAEAFGDVAASDHLKAQGIVGGEELRSMSVLTRSGRRLSWLSINILLNLAAASVIALYQDTLSSAIVLAIFLPIISDMSGCSGNQAIAVSMRELTLGVIQPRDAWLVLRQELAVGLLNAVVLGIVLGGTAYLWKGNLYLSLVVGAALALNTVVSVALGGVVPLALRGLRFDPALASGPLLTTVTDMCGFFFVLSFASAVLPMLR